jgi:hypothetical protein
MQLQKQPTASQCAVSRGTGPTRLSERRFRAYPECTESLRALASIKIVGSPCDLAHRPIIAGEFFSTKNGAPPGNKASNPQITPMQRILAICGTPDRRGLVTPTKIILIYCCLRAPLAMHSPIRPVVLTFNATPRIRARRFAARRTVGDKPNKAQWESIARRRDSLDGSRE